MVAISSLNLDVLELIFSFLPVNDLYSVALVNHAFYDGVISRLYRTISYRLRHAKAYEAGSVMSPFTVLKARQSLAVHVRQIEIRTVPRLKEKLHPRFMKETGEAIALCQNLRLFKCAIRNILPLFLRPIQNKALLEDLRVAAHLTEDQTPLLTQHTKLRTLSLQYASWNVIDALPLWSERLQSTLTSLTLYMVHSVQEDILKTVLLNLPNLIAFHVVGCARVDHLNMLRLLGHAPHLESLAFTVSESTKAIDAPNQLMPSLKHLALDIRYSPNPGSTAAIIALVMNYMKTTTAPLSSLVFKLPERNLSLSDEFVVSLARNHGETLRRVAFIDCSVSLSGIADLCDGSPRLERLEVSIPMKDLTNFAHSIGASRSIRVLVDIENHVEHGLRQSIGKENARFIMLHCTSLKKIISGEKIWTGQRRTGREVDIMVEKRHSHGHGSLWFMQIARGD